ncbi:MAG: DedA family protein [Candidatus Saccharibacteria bacterium]|jgi:membrane protein DedA with SNARE-associated domain
MTDTITNIVADFGYLGIFLAMFIETIFPPLPSELILPFGGYAAYRGQLNIYGVIVAGALGSLVGAGLFYTIGSALQEHHLLAFVKKYGKYIGLKPKDITRSANWFEKHGLSAVFFARLLPGMRSLISLPAGLHKMKLIPFLLLSFLGALAWSAILSFGGFVLGEQYELIAANIKPLSYLVLVGVLISLGYFIYRRVVGSIEDDDLS